MHAGLTAEIGLICVYVCVVCRGDSQLRSNFSARTIEGLSQLGKEPGSVLDVLDIGAATG